VLWVKSTSSKVCLGKVVTSKFCTKMCDEEKTSCGTLNHSSKFTILPNSAHLQVSDTAALCHALELSSFNDFQQSKILCLTKTSAEGEKDLNESLQEICQNGMKPSRGVWTLGKSSPMLIHLNYFHP
jgi:hypothetical protein